MLCKTCKYEVTQLCTHPVVTVGVVISVTPMAPRLRRHHHLKTAATTLRREQSISWSLRIKTCHPFRLKLSVKPGTGNGTKHTNMFPQPGMLNFTFLSTMLFLSRGIDGAWCEDTMTSFRPPVWGWGQFPASVFSTWQEIVPETGLRSGGKLAATRKTCKASQHVKQRLKRELL